MIYNLEIFSKIGVYEKWLILILPVCTKAQNSTKLQK